MYCSYTCTFAPLNVTFENLEVEAFTGEHLPGYYNQEVTEILVFDGTLLYIPDGIGLLFQHLKKFLIGHRYIKSGLKLIKRSNFQHMKLLTKLDLRGTAIETVNVDTLWDLTNLELFLFYDSQLKVLHEKIFEKNTKLRVVNIDENRIEYLPKDLFKFNPEIEIVSCKNNKLYSISTDFTELREVSEIDLHGNSCIDKALKDFHNVSELQNVILSSC